MISLLMYQASFTIKEARELMHLFDTNFNLPDSSLLPPEESNLPRTQRRLVALLRQGSIEQPNKAMKTWTLDSMLSPLNFVGTESKNRLEAIMFGSNRFEDPAQRFQPQARVTPIEGSPEIAIPCSAAFRSIGYKSTEIAGMTDLSIDFDKSQGVILNDGFGRIVGLDSVSPGLYCAGWVKRGPAGVIANTMEDSFATADAILHDWDEKQPFLQGGNGWDTISQEAAVRHLQTTSWDDWLKIDAAEKARGKLVGKEREKFTSTQDMLKVGG